MVRVADADMLARLLPQFAIPFVGRDDGGVALLGQHHLDQILHIFDMSYA